MNEQDEALLTKRQLMYLKANPGTTLAEAGESEASEQPKSLVGFDGWLMFLGISLVALGPLITVITTVSELSLNPDLFDSYRGRMAIAFGWFHTAIYCLISIFSGRRIFKHLVPITIPIVISCIWLMGPVLTVLGLIVEAAIFDGHITSADAAGSLGRPLVYCTVWTMYLLTSKRVKNTYRNDSTSRSWSEKLNRSSRKFIFFSLCWVVLSFSYYTFVSPPDPHADNTPNMWAIMFLPPLFIRAGTWCYRKFVGTSSE